MEEKTGEAGKKPRAIGLMSGGLDSVLAAKAMTEQGIDVLGVCFIISFTMKDKDAFQRHVAETCESISVPVKFVDISEKYLTILKDPPHGYGAHINPCIDCKIMMLREARKIMEEEGASFVFTGEVIGERPMSQRSDAMKTIIRESGLEGYLLRPLSAQVITPTIAEEKGIVDRSRLYSITGRSRKPQMALAKKWGIDKFSSPGGGCLLTDDKISARVRDLMAHEGLEVKDLELLTVGRHFRVNQGTKVVVARNAEECTKLSERGVEGDYLMELKDEIGPVVLVRGRSCTEGTLQVDLEDAGALCLSHSKCKNCEQAWVNVRMVGKEGVKVQEVHPLSSEEVESRRV
eukprot:TRINITY_DN39425_c0_g2_i4.p1 TRINITY_DN39425_c0_g2~~TRINITY_DN39425_c0_g2_i4.p1  ORF type:complete len:376 (+),score=97.98 TRINITY_DN39425_c0_g2_i4:88-1128(+)